MIIYDKFAFASPPYVGGEWFVDLCKRLDLKSEDMSQDIYNRFAIAGVQKLSVSLVRHPYTWLKVYFRECKIYPNVFQVDDRLTKLIRESEDWHGFAQGYLDQCPGLISEIFNSYHVSSVMRYEDLFWASVEFFSSMGLNTAEIRKVVLLNSLNNHQSNLSSGSDLCKKICDTEEEFCDRFEYNPYFISSPYSERFQTSNSS